MSFLDLDFNSLYSKLESIVDKKTAAVCENMIRDLEQNMEAKDKQLLSEQNRFVRLKEFISKHAKCVGCEKKFDTILHIPYVLTCGHTVCSFCFFNIPIISVEDEQQYIKYIKEKLPAPPSLQKNESEERSFTGAITRAAAAAAGAVSSVAGSLFDDPAKRVRFMRSYQEKVRQIEEQQKHLQGFEHIGKCPVCKTPQRGLRYDLLATFNAVKEFSFGKNKRNKKSSKNKKSKSIKRKNKNKKSKRKSIKRSKK